MNAVNTMTETDFNQHKSKDAPLSMDDIKDCYYQPSTQTVIDTIHPITGVGVWSKKTLAETQAEYDGAEVWDFDKAIEHKQNEAKTAPKEISAERFEEMLYVLPPVGWKNEGGAESFKMSERWSGNITGIYCRIGERFFEFLDDISLSHDAICKRCKDTETRKLTA